MRWTPPAIPTSVRVYYGIMSADSAQGVISGMEGEEVNENYQNLLLMLKVPKWIKSLLIMICRLPRVQQLRAALMLASLHPKGGEELYEYNALLNDVVAQVTASWQAEEFDAVICPGFGTPALLHGGSKDLTIAASYTFLWNIMHYPAGSVPDRVDRGARGQI